MEPSALLPILPILGFVALFTYTITPRFSGYLYQKGMTGIDVHKQDQPLRPEMGGIICLIALGMAAILLYLVGTESSILLGLLTIILSGLVGALDDVHGIRQRYKPLLTAASSIPLILTLTTRHGFTMPGLGYLDFGYAYLIIIVPIGLATSTNLANMLAGFNGLETGTGSIILLTLTALSFYKGYPTTATIGLLSLASLIPFLRYNWYPARVFPGDTGTLFIGAAIATISLQASLEVAAIICLTPAIIDFALKITSKAPFGQRHIYGNTVVQPDGTLTPPRYRALAHAFLRLTPLSEPDLVRSILIMQVFYSLGAIMLVITQS